MTDTEGVTCEGDLFRATSWAQFVGQNAMKARLDTHVQAALTDDRFLEHCLFAGPPGFGKTSLAHILAFELGQELVWITMPLKPKALISLLRQTSFGDLIFFDEIHRAPKAQQEDLLTLFEEGYLQLTGGGRLEWHGTFLAATTEPEKVIPPLYDRVPIKPTFEDYTPADMGRIVELMAGKAEIDLASELCVELGKATAGTPRNAKAFVLAARDLYSVGRPVTIETVLELCDTDPDGLSRLHLEYLRNMGRQGGTAGLAAMTTLLRLNQPMVREVERVLLKYGYITLGTGGRELTNLGWEKTR